MIFIDDQDNNDMEEADLAFRTSILESFSQPESRLMRHTSRTKQSHNNPFHAESPPEGALTRDGAKQQVTPPKFNNNSTIKMPMPDEFRYFPMVKEVGTGEFLYESDNENESCAEETRCEIQYLSAV
jgi:hypothetical protein